MSKQLSAYDRVAILMAIEEKIFRACEPLREQGGPLGDGVRDSLEEAVAQLGKEDPAKLLSVLIRGACDSLSHDVIDRRVEKKFGAKVAADSEGDSIFIYCSEDVKDEVLSFLRSSFEDIEVEAEGRDDHPLIAGLSTWDDALKWVEEHGLEEHAVIDPEVALAISARYDLLIQKKRKKHEEEIEALLAKKDLATKTKSSS